MQEPARAHRLAKLWPALKARPRLLGSILFGIAAYGVVTALFDFAESASVLIAWNAGALLYLALTLHMVWDEDAQDIQRRSLTQDEGRITILVVVILASAAVLVAVGTQLAQVKNYHGSQRVVHILLSVLTVVTSWLFTQTVFATHYAHDFYLARARQRQDPLAFPGTKDPLYGDFFHFACVIGTAGQTADISFNGSTLRPIGTLHCIVAFVFNTTLIALSINVVASLIV
jgi:uncharacterized membrane protein